MKRVQQRGLVYRVFAMFVVAVTGVSFLSSSIAAAVPTINEYATPTASSGSVHMTFGPDGNIWFSEYSVDKIGKMNPTTKVITEYDIPTSGARPWGITAGPDGNVWFVENLGHKVAKITPSGVITEYSLMGNNNPSDITTGPDGNLWVTSVGGNSIVKIDPANGVVLGAYPLGGGAKNPAGITSGPDGNLWFVENTGNAIGKITTDGVLTEYALPNGGSRPWQIITGPDGNLWFTQQEGHRLGKMTTSGSLIEYTLPGGSGPWGIVVGPDNNIWVTLNGSNKIGMFNTDGEMVGSYDIPTANSIAAGIAKDNTNKVWFAEFVGNIGEVTDITIPPYDDGDGVSEAEENAAPNDGDGNNDGIPDGRQANVTSFVSPVTGNYVTVALNNSCSITSVTVAAEAANVAQDEHYKYPFGLVDFAADCGTTGYTASVKLYFYDAVGELSVRKYNPTTYQYAAVPNAVQSTQTIGGVSARVVEYDVTDGGLLDTDGVANGTIIDPVGLAELTPASGVVPGAPNTGAEPTSAAYDSSVWALTVTASVVALAGAGFVALRHRV